MLPLPAPSRWLLRGSDPQTSVSSAWAYFLCPRRPVPHLLWLLRPCFLLQLSNLPLPPSPCAPSGRLSPPSQPPSPRDPRPPYTQLSAWLLPLTSSSPLPRLLTLPSPNFPTWCCPQHSYCMCSLIFKFFPPHTCSKCRSYWITWVVVENLPLSSNPRVSKRKVGVGVGGAKKP